MGLQENLVSYVQKMSLIFYQVLKNMMKLKSRKDESDERDEPIVSEDELEHEVCTLKST